MAQSSRTHCSSENTGKQNKIAEIDLTIPIQIKTRIGTRSTKRGDKQEKIAKVDLATAIEIRFTGDLLQGQETQPAESATRYRAAYPQNSAFSESGTTPHQK